MSQERLAVRKGYPIYPPFWNFQYTEAVSGASKELMPLRLLGKGRARSAQRHAAAAERGPRQVGANSVTYLLLIRGPKDHTNIRVLYSG